MAEWQGRRWGPLVEERRPVLECPARETAVLISKENEDSAPSLYLESLETAGTVTWLVKAAQGVKLVGMRDCLTVALEVVT